MTDKEHEVLRRIESKDAIGGAADNQALEFLIGSGFATKGWTSVHLTSKGRAYLNGEDYA